MQIFVLFFFRFKLSLLDHPVKLRNLATKSSMEYRSSPKNRIWVKVPGGSDSRTCLQMQETWIKSLDQEDPLEEGLVPDLSILAQRIPKDRGASWAAIYEVVQSWTRLKRLSSSSSSTCQQSYVQNPSSQASAVCELRNSRCTSWIQKRKKNQRSYCQHSLDHRESKGIPEKHLFLLH